MILFCAGIGRDAEVAPARAALESLLERLPFFPGRPVEDWRPPSAGAAAAWVSHAPEQVGGVRHVAARDDGLHLFAGRPIAWTGASTADGDAPLDPAFYSGPAASWAPALDGRFAAVRLTTGPQPELEAVTDPMGAYPLFTAEAGRVRWVSNSPALLALLTGTGAPRPGVLASLLGGGWSLSGDPLDETVSRLPRGAIVRYPRGAVADLLPLGRIVAMPGAGFDADAAAGILVEAVSALSGWPGRPDVVPVTAGRDSRLVLAAALAAGLDFEATTGGAPDAPDVAIGRLLCERVGIPHVPLAGDPHGDMWGSPRRMAEIVSLLGGGTACVADAAGFPLGPREGPLVLWHSGQGGEIGRGYYSRVAGGGPEALAVRLLRAFTGRRPGRPGVLGVAGEALVRAEIESFVETCLAAGASPRDIPDLFYLERRMGTWAGPSHACVEPVKDTTSPLWSVRLLPQILGLPAEERARERFHLRVLERLEPRLVDIPFEGGGAWPRDRSVLGSRVARARTLAGKAVGEARRRAVRRGGTAPAAGPVPEDPFAAVHREVGKAVAAQSGHPAWEVLDRERVERLLSRDPAALDVMSRYYVWRMGQVFWEGWGESAGNRVV